MRSHLTCPPGKSMFFTAITKEVSEWPDLNLPVFGALLQHDGFYLCQGVGFGRVFVFTDHSVGDVLSKFLSPVVVVHLFNVPLEMVLPSDMVPASWAGHGVALVHVLGVFLELGPFHLFVAQLTRHGLVFDEPFAFFYVSPHLTNTSNAGQYLNSIIIHIIIQKQVSYSRTHNQGCVSCS